MGSGGFAAYFSHQMHTSPGAGPSDRPRILILPKWWPNARDPQLGDFIRKQVQAVALLTPVTVLLVEGSANIRPQAMASQEDGLDVIRSTYAPSQASSKPLRKIVNFYRYWGAAMRGWRTVLQKRGKPDLIHVHILVRPAVVAYFIGRGHGIPYIVSEQSSEYLDGTYASKGGLFHGLNKWIFRKAAAVTAVSAWLGDGLVRLGLCERYEVVPNVVPGLDRPLPPRGAQGHFLVVADLVDRTKNVSGVIRALAALKERHPDMRLSIIGDGPDRVKLENLAREHDLQDRVKFLGRLPNSAVLDHMAGCGAVVINSNVETFSVVTGEALAQGKPVIATRCGGPQGFVTPANGELIPVADHEALVQAMERLVNEASRFDPVSIRSSVHERFSPSAVGEGFLRIYQRSLGITTA